MCLELVTLPSNGQMDATGISRNEYDADFDSKVQVLHLCMEFCSMPCLKAWIFWSNISMLE